MTIHEGHDGIVDLFTKSWFTVQKLHLLNKNKHNLRYYYINSTNLLNFINQILPTWNSIDLTNLHQIQTKFHLRFHTALYVI